MNRDNLYRIFESYIDNFESVNAKHDEHYKWEIAQTFQSFDVEAEPFVDILTTMWKASKNLIDSGHQLPFYALVDYATNFNETETVRDMFWQLYADECLDTAEKQRRIDAFIEKSEELRLKHKPDSHLYIANQGAVMQLLFLKYPNSNYGYKATQAKRFADCIEFYDDWGPMSNFRLDVYNRMCDRVMEEIRQCKPLLDTHRSRYKSTGRTFHADENLHILLLDIIYCSQTYNFYKDISFEPITVAARKLYWEKAAKAKTLEEAFIKAKRDAALLEEGLQFLQQALFDGFPVQHKTMGNGFIREISGTFAETEFPTGGKRVKLSIPVAVSHHLLTLGDPSVVECLVPYLPILLKEFDIPKKLQAAEKALAPYMEFLN